MSKKFWNMKVLNKEDGKTEGQIDIYDQISSRSWWGDELTPKTFKNDLDNLGKVDVLNIYINSPGGDVFAGNTIYNMLKRHEAKKKVYIDGLAASIASIIAMAGDIITMPSNALIMIHNPSTFAWGDSNNFRNIADDLDKIKDGIVGIYVKRTGLKKEEIENYMNNETWFDPIEAKELGFADEIDQEKEIAAKLVNEKLYINNVESNFKNYKNPPKINIKSVEIKKKEINVTNEVLKKFKNLDNVLEEIKSKKSKY